MLRAYEQYEKAASDYTSGINGTKRDIARKMKSKGKPVDEIADDTGLSPEEIERL
jgi:hypothetical protein